MMLKIAYHPLYKHPLPDNHRFPMEKYELLPEQLLHEGTITQASFFKPDAISEELILRIHDADYWKRLSGLELTPREQRKTGFPHSEQLIHRERVIMQGTVQATEFALEFGVAMNIAGGTHHAYRDRGEGFCLLNDIALGAIHLLDSGKAKQILVVDLDVHQGNGTAQIFQNDSRVFTFSMHGAANYPLHKEQSDLDIALPDGTDDRTYLELLDRNLKELVDRLEPDFIFFQSGVDVLASDKLGKLGMTIEGCKKRDALVWEICKRHEIPVVASMGGGYSPDIKHIIEAHANTYRLANHYFF